MHTFKEGRYCRGHCGIFVFHERHVADENLDPMNATCKSARHLLNVQSRLIRDDSTRYLLQWYGKKHVCFGDKQCVKLKISTAQSTSSRKLTKSKSRAMVLTAQQVTAFMENNDQMGLSQLTHIHLQTEGILTPGNAFHRELWCTLMVYCKDFTCTTHTQ